MPRGNTHHWKIEQLSKTPDAIAVDTTEVRKGFAEVEASVVHCTLPPNAVSVATRNVDPYEIWHFLEGRGRIWLKEEDEEKGREKDVGPGTCLTIPAGVHFQYRNLGEDFLRFLCVTMPPFRSQEANNERVLTHWIQE
jgi:mannose-6-phosphate isomerase-like protein (cupin superfamily)